MEKLINKKYLLRGILVLLLFWFSSLIQYIPIYLFHLDVKTLTIKQAVLLSVFASVVITFILFFVYRKELKEEFRIYRKNLGENFDVGLKYWLVGFLIMMVSNAILVFVFKSGGANNQKVVQKMVDTLPLLMLIDAGFIAPFNEEIIFRKTIKDVIKNKWLFVACSFLLFGGAHVFSSAETILDYLYIIPYGALGAAFAFAYSKTDTVFTSMTLHMLHNTLLTIISILL